MALRIVISDPKSGKAYQVELKDASKLLGKKIGDTLEGDLIGLPGYRVMITGGSDRDGFPMRSDLPGMQRKRLLLTGGVGYKPRVKGQKRRKSVCGREVSPNTSQLNVKITEHGAKPVEELIKS